MHIQTQNHLNLLIRNICFDPQRSFSTVKLHSRSNQ